MVRPPRSGPIMGSISLNARHALEENKARKSADVACNAWENSWLGVKAESAMEFVMNSEVSLLISLIVASRSSSRRWRFQK